MRGSLETELMERHPIHAVTAWLGHDSRVAMKHYLMVRNADFEAALQGGTECGTASSGRFTHGNAEFTLTR